MELWGNYCSQHVGAEYKVARNGRIVRKNWRVDSFYDLLTLENWKVHDKSEPWTIRVQVYSNWGWSSLRLGQSSYFAWAPYSGAGVWFCSWFWVMDLLWAPISQLIIFLTFEELLMASQTPSSGQCLSYLQRLGAIEAKVKFKAFTI